MQVAPGLLPRLPGRQPGLGRSLESLKDRSGWKKPRNRAEALHSSCYGFSHARPTLDISKMASRLQPSQEFGGPRVGCGGCLLENSEASLKVHVGEHASFCYRKTFQVDSGPEAPRPKWGWGVCPNSWFHLDFCVINRRLPVAWPQVSSKPLLPYKENPL